MRLRSIATALFTALISLTATGEVFGPVNGKLQLHFINVGEGDAALLVSPGGETVMFDNGGSPECDRTLSYLQQLGVSRIDYHIASHYHPDHIGCTAELFSELPLMHAAYDRGPGDGEDVYNSYVNAIGSKRRPVTTQTTIALDKDSAHPVTIRFAAVNANGKTAAGEDDRSVVTVVSFDHFKAVLGGDVTGFAENDSVDLETAIAASVGQVDVYKVHDHGSRHSTNAAWLETVRPRIGIVSTGTANRQGRPSQECIARLHQAGVRTYWTAAGNGVEPQAGMDIVGGNIVVDVAADAKIFTVRTTAGPKGADEYPIWAAGAPARRSGLSHVMMTTTAPTVSYTWSRRANVYHYSSCRWAKNISPDLLMTNTIPPPDKSLHKGCPK